MSIKLIERDEIEMKKIILVLIFTVLIIGAGIWWWNYTKNSENKSQNISNTSNYQAERSSTNNNTIINNNSNTNKVTKSETEIAEFSTKIYSKDEERQNNINITCKALSAKEIKPGETFSFCDTVGKSTEEKGYKEADIYVEGKKEQGLGGGNCQVSTTLYNAVLKVSELEVIERHQHSGHVPYVEEGKDAAVSYGSYDFKFKNNTNNTIKIIMENTEDNITAKIIKIEEIKTAL